MTDFDLAVTFPSPGVIRLGSRSLFSDAGNPHYRRFLEGVFQAEEISSVTIKSGSTPHAELRFCADTNSLARRREADHCRAQAVFGGKGGRQIQRQDTHTF